MVSSSLLVGLLASVTSVLGARSAGCDKAATVSSRDYTVNIAGQNRQYRVQLPQNYNPATAYKLIFTWHQLGGSMQKIVQGENVNAGGVAPYYGLPPLANNSAIFVVPQGLNAGWANQGGNDVAFFDAMSAAVEAGACIETSLRFSTGFSYGGGMSYALACARTDKIRAIAVISGAQLSGCAGGTQPVAFYGQHGTSDSVLNVGMGRQLKNNFVRNNGCQTQAEPNPNGNRPTTVEYQGCRPDYPVQWVIHNGDHNPSQRDNNVIFAAPNTMNFFNRFQPK